MIVLLYAIMLIAPVIGYIILYFLIKTAVTNGIIEAHEIIGAHKSGRDIRNEDEEEQFTDQEPDGERVFVKTDCPVCRTKHEAGLDRCPTCDFEYK